MFVFGIDIPLVEFVFAAGVISIIILLEITAVLVLITYHMKNSRKLEAKLGLIVPKLMQLESKELKELEKLADLIHKEQGMVSRIKTKKSHRSKVHKSLTLKQREKLYEDMHKEDKGESVLEKVDKFIRGIKK